MTAGIGLSLVVLAQNLADAEESGDDQRVAVALNDLCAHLGLDPNETELGLSPEAAERIETFVSLVLIAAENALSAETENDLEERGLIVQTDGPYATLTDAGLTVLGVETGSRHTEVGLRSGADARAAGRVPEYADLMKQTLLDSGQSEEEAEANRQRIIERFGREGAA